MPKKASKEKNEGFAFRIKLGEYEVEIHGTPQEVKETLNDLPKTIANVHKAFEHVKPKTVATLTVKTEPTAKAKETPKASAQTAPLQLTTSAIFGYVCTNVPENSRCG